MPNIKSAKKRVLVIQKKNLRNRSILSEVKTAIKKYNNAIDTNHIEEAEVLLPATVSVIDSAVSKGVLHKNTASNYKSGLSKRLSNVKSGKIVIDIKKDNKTIAAEKAKAAKDAREAVRAENAKKAQERTQLRNEQKAADAKTEKAKPKAAKAEKVEKVEKPKVEKPKAEKTEKAKAEKAEKVEKPKAEKKVKKDE